VEKGPAHAGQCITEDERSRLPLDEAQLIGHVPGERHGLERNPPSEIQDLALGDGQVDVPWAVYRGQHLGP
jgi:hypothetical protein